MRSEIRGKLALRADNVSYFAISLKANEKILKTVLSDSTGVFSFFSILPGTYKIEVRQFRKRIKVFDVPFLGGILDLGEISVSETQELHEVTILGSKPFLERQIDRLTMNVRNNVLAKGNSALDILSFAPGVKVSLNGSISLNGRSGVLMIVDGKPQRLPAREVLNFLNGLNADQIDKIDLISVPPAKYDSEGSGGVIEISTIKSKMLSDIHSILGHQVAPSPAVKSLVKPYYNVGTSINYDFGKIKVTSAIDYFDRGDYQASTSENRFIGEKTFSNKNSLVSNQKNKFIVYRAGINLDISKNLSLDIATNGSGTIENRINNFTTSQYVSNVVYDSSQISNADYLTEKYLYNSSIVSLTKRNISNSFKALAISFENNHVENRYNTSYRNEFFNPKKTLQEFNIYRSYYVNISALRIDNSSQYKNFSLDYGAKVSIIANKDNSVISGYAPVTNNVFRYDENILATYISTKFKIRKVEVQAGLRSETTNSSGKSNTEADNQTHKISRGYTNIFPTLNLKYNLKKNTITYAATRRVRRPTYEEFNPYSYYRSANTSLSGNLSISPQFTTGHEISWFNNGRYLLVSYTNTKNIRVVVPDSNYINPQRINQHISSLSNGNTFFMLFSFPIILKKWGRVNVNLDWSSNFMRLLNGVRSNGHGITASAYHQISIGSRFKIDYRINLNSKNNYSYMTTGASMNFASGASFDMPRTRLNIALNVNDIFAASQVKFISRYDNADWVTSPVSNNRYYRLNIRYKFYSGKVFNPKSKSSSNNGEVRF